MRILYKGSLEKDHPSHTLPQYDHTLHTATQCPFGNDRNALTRKRDFGKAFKPSLASTPASNKVWPTDACAEFNACGSCSFDKRFKYHHICGQCLGLHAEKVCPAKARLYYSSIVFIAYSQQHPPPSPLYSAIYSSSHFVCACLLV